MNDFEGMIQAIRLCAPDQKQQIFSEIRDSIAIHELEKSFNVRAEIILEAISRASDLTQRGVRGIIAETVFALEVLPTVQGWENETPVGDLSYDACLRKDTHRVRVQVKMQRKERGQPKRSRNCYVVEVQRTRSGMSNGIKTRPYRFGEFDLLAVCMEPSTRSWHSFMYAPTAALQPDLKDNNVIKTFQYIPCEQIDHDIWMNDLLAALEQIAAQKPDA